jgi:hypothetical protein
MELAESKNNSLVKTGKWKQQSVADRKIVALTAQLNELKVPKPEKVPEAAAAKHPKDKKKGEVSTTDKWFLTPPNEGEPPKQQKGENTGGGAQSMPRRANGFATIQPTVNNPKDPRLLPSFLLGTKRRRTSQNPA